MMDHLPRWLNRDLPLGCLLAVTLTGLNGCKSQAKNQVVIDSRTTNSVFYVQPVPVPVFFSNSPALNITNVTVISITNSSVGLPEHPVSINISGLPLPPVTNNIQISGSLNLTQDSGAGTKDLTKWPTVAISFFTFIVAALTLYLNHKVKVQEKRSAISGNVAAILARAQGLLEKAADLKKRLAEFTPSDDPDKLDVPRRIEAGDLNGELLKMTGRLEQIRLKAIEILDSLNNKSGPGNKVTELDKLRDLTQQILKSFESEGDVTLSGYEQRINRLLAKIQ